MVVLRRDTTDFILRLEDEYHNMLNRIVEHKRNITNRHQLNEVRATITAIGMSETERQFAPAWAFECMGSAIFRRVLNTTSLAAYEVALAHVNRIPGCASFTMKELICSPGVSDMFAFLVAANFLSSGKKNHAHLGEKVTPQPRGWLRSHRYASIWWRRRTEKNLFECDKSS